MYELGVVYRNIQRADRATADALAALGSATVHEAMGRVGLMKPHRAIFELAQERFALSEAQTVFIDDHAGNIAAAQAHGWQGVHFSSAAQAERELQQAGWLPGA